MKGVAIYLGLVVVALVLFRFAPGIDLTVSGLFYDPAHGFLGAGWPPVRALVAAIPIIVGLIVAVCVVGAAWLYLARRPLWRLDGKGLAFIALSTALGPGLLVNTILKDHWGRARPSQIVAFGGTHLFTTPPLPAAQCAQNCSFVSGHAALGFSLVAFALLLAPGRRRVAVQAVALGFGALVGLARIAEGAHFLSDVVDAGLLVYGTSWLLHAGIVERDALASPVARRGGAVGRALAAAWATPAGRIALWAAALVLIETATMAFVDRPTALLAHDSGPDLRALFGAITLLGLGYPPLVLCAVAAAALRWGGAAPRLRAHAARLRAAALIPIFLFVSVAASGLVADVLKILCGRTRPKLLFASGIDAFTGLALRADHWSFPSGHTTTIAAVATGLWCIWPRHLLFYILVVAIVAASRVVVGAHYPSDAIMGVFVAVATTRLTAYLFGRAGFGIDRVTLGGTGPSV